jgi:ParB family chromosome partitioning protein
VSGDHSQQVQLEKLDERLAELRLPRPEVVAALRRSIPREGMLRPMVANRRSDGSLTLLDGFKRMRVVRELGWSRAPAKVIAVDEAAARVAMMTYNHAQQGLGELEEAWIVRSLVRSCNLQQKQVAKILGRDKSWVSRRLLLAERLEPGVQQDMRLGLLNATTARELARLPRGNQLAAAQAVREHSLSTRQCTELVERCLAAEQPIALAAVLEDPRRFIDAPPNTDQHSLARDPRLSERGESIRQRLLWLERSTQAACQVLRQYPPVALGAEDLALLVKLAKPIRRRTGEAETLLGELCSSGGADE